MAWALAVAYAPMPAGLTGTTVVAFVALSSLGRCRRALWVNVGAGPNVLSFGRFQNAEGSAAALA